MSNANATANPTAREIRAELRDAEPMAQQVVTSSYRCPQCQGAIAPECALGNMRVDKQTHRTLRVMRLWCEHCDVVFGGTLRIQGDQLVPMGAFTPVTDPDERAAFLRRVDSLRGNRQLQTA